MSSPPLGLRWRASTLFIIATVAVGIFTDLFLYGLIVPVLPFLLRERVSLPQEEVQSYSSALLAAYAAASVCFSLPAGWIADRTSSRRLPFLSGIAALLAATLLLALGQSIAVLVVARVLQGMSGAVVWTVGLAMIMDTVGVENLGKVMGTIFSIVSVGELAAPVLGGVLYAKTGFAGVFALSAGVLGTDFIMRLLVVEKKVAVRYGYPQQEDPNRQSDDNDNDDPEDPSTAAEDSTLIPKPEADYYRVPSHRKQIPLLRNLPILYCLTSPRLLTALLLAFMHALILGSFDATVPTEAQSLFSFTSLTSGLLFVALDIPYLIFGPLAGWTVDQYGPKPASVFGFGYLAPALILLRLPHADGGKGQVILYCGLLALCGVGMGVIGSPSIVESSHVVQKFDRANGDFFGKNGPYAQLYGLNSLVFSAGLTVGPLLAGSLRDTIGYGNMNLVVAVLSGITAVLSFVFIGGRPRVLRFKENR
jgi:MFS family permease